MKRLSRLALWLLRATLTIIVIALAIVGGVLLIVETGWGKNRLRELIISQANQYLTATLHIDSLSGSLLRGIQLGNVTLSRSGETLVQIDDVSVSYSIRELVEQGTVVRRIALARPRFLVAREPDGRWNLGALIKRETNQEERSGPRRPIHLMDIEISDADVTIRDPLTFGAAHLPSHFEDLDLKLTFDYQPVDWTLKIEHASWKGHEPEFSVSAMTGTLGNGKNGWTFRDFDLALTDSHVLVDGAVDRSVTPSALHITTRAERFRFQEWAPILPAISRIGVSGSFAAKLDGPLEALDTTIDLHSDGGDAKGGVRLNTRVPGWRFAGSLDVNRIDLGRWLTRPEDVSDISGRVAFDLGIKPGAHFPHGTYAFDGSYAWFMGYEGADVRASGRLTDTEVQIDEATATAYGANVRLRGGSLIGLAAPYPYKFVGVADGVDLRLVPASVPIPHVESRLTLNYDVAGQFTDGFIIGNALFGPSQFLGATIEDQTRGFIDTQSKPFRYSGAGTITGIDLNRFGTGLNVAWLQDARYAGSLSGYFEVQGDGAEAAAMTLTANGRLARADLFGGRLSDGQVSLEIRDGSLTGSYDGGMEGIRPALAFGDARFDSILTGQGRGRVFVQDLMRRSSTLDDYTIDAAMNLTAGSQARQIDVTRGTVNATLKQSTLRLERLELDGPALVISASGPLELDDVRPSAIDYAITRADLAQLKPLLGRDVAGQLVTTGRLTGPLHEIRLVGDGTLSQLDASGVKALAMSAKYDTTVPTAEPAKARALVDGRLTFIDAFGQQLKEAAGTVNYDAGRARLDVKLTQDDGLEGTIKSDLSLDVPAQTITFATLELTSGNLAWLLNTDGPAQILWDDRGITARRLRFVDAGSRRQEVTADGTWLYAGGGALRVTGRNISLDSLLSGSLPAARYGGTLAFDGVAGGTRALPTFNGTLTVADGRIARTPYQMITVRLAYADHAFDVDLTVDQAPGVSLTAIGKVPLGLFLASEPDLPIDLAIKSNNVGFGLVEGATDVLRNVTGALEIDLRVVGTSGDPHFRGRIDISNAAFLVSSSGARYKNARLAVQLASDQITVETLHLEDSDSHPLDVKGSLATHELRVGNLAIDVRSRDFEVLRNQYGRMRIDSDVQLRGQFETPRLEGKITVTGGQLQVDAILDRTLFQPYATEATTLDVADAIAALNPWERMGLGLELHVPGTLRLVGDNVQVSPGTPIGLGDINLRAIGDLYLYKDPAQPLYVTGSLDSVTGTYRFQGRSFTLDPASSINFRGDLNPDIFVTVEREISAVQTRVTIAGPLNEPELRLSSTPPLDASDILSLIVFNTSTNELSALQQQQLAVRAGALAAGFLSAPIVTALERSLGLDTLEIEPVSEPGGAARVTIGNEIAPGLVARFSRQFGEVEYDEATIEYYLSRIFRIRATFSDASGLARYPFRRVERAGIDFLLYFNF